MKLLSINIGINLSNTSQVANYIKQSKSDFVVLQESVRHLEKSVFEQFRSKEGLEKILGNVYKDNFFGPLWISDAFVIDGKVTTDFGGHIEMGNQVLSRYEILSAENEHFYKTYSYARDWTDWKKTDRGRALLSAEFNVNGKKLQILNIHGIWTYDKKGDQRTIEECQYVVSVAKRKNIPTIIVGDFNLLPETESIKIIEKEFRNLVKEYGIKTTRPTLDDGIDKGDQIVDYIFVNDEIRVTGFEVQDSDISDHLPLVMDFEFT